MKVGGWWGGWYAGKHRDVRLHLCEYLRLASLGVVREAAYFVVPAVCRRGHVVTLEVSVHLPVSQGDLGSIPDYF